MEYRWDFGAVFRHADLLMEGALATFRLAGMAMAIAIPLGLFVALLRLSRLPVISWIAVLYTDLFRTSPSIVLIYWFFFAFPLLVGINFDTFTAVSLTLGLQTGAYMSEVFRGGIESIRVGQWQAAKALGMGMGTTLRYVILPQAVRRMIPVFFTRLTELFKATSLAAVVSYGEIVQMASRTSSETFRPIETYTIVALFFFVVIFMASRLVRLAERRFAVPE